MRNLAYEHGPWRANTWWGKRTFVAKRTVTRAERRWLTRSTSRHGRRDYHNPKPEVTDCFSFEADVAP